MHPGGVRDKDEGGKETLSMSSAADSHFRQLPLSPSSNTLGSVFLQLSPALVKFKVFEHRELWEPWGIAINNKDELVVCTRADERGTRDVVLSREGETSGKIISMK